MDDWEMVKLRVRARQREQEASAALLEILKRRLPFLPIVVDPMLPDDTMKMGDVTLTNIKPDEVQP